MPRDLDPVLLRRAAEVLVAMIGAAERDDRLALVALIGRLLNALVEHRDAARRPDDEALRRAIERIRA